MRCDGPESTDCLYLVNYLAQNQLLWLRAASGLSQSFLSHSSGRMKMLTQDPRPWLAMLYWVAESRPECPNSLGIPESCCCLLCSQEELIRPSLWRAGPPLPQPASETGLYSNPSLAVRSCVTCSKPFLSFHRWRERMRPSSCGGIL